MSSASVDQEALHDLIEARLRQADKRYTAGRRAIVELLACSDRPVSISEIAERLPSLPRSSAYRHLVELEQAGAVRRIAATDDFSRFELAEEITEHHHHHLLCKACGKVVDFTPPKGFERSVRKAIEELANAAGFTAESHQLDIFGTCAACRTKRPSHRLPRPAKTRSPHPKVAEAQA